MDLEDIDRVERLETVIFTDLQNAGCSDSSKNFWETAIVKFFSFYISQNAGKETK